MKAEELLLSVERDSGYAVKSVAELVEIAAEKKDYENVLLWISEGEKLQGERFVSSRFGYLQVLSYLNAKRLGDAKKALRILQDKNAESDLWVELAQAEMELTLAKDQINTRVDHTGGWAVNKRHREKAGNNG
jgi:hypothetical protein